MGKLGVTSRTRPASVVGRMALLALSLALVATTAVAATPYSFVTQWGSFGTLDGDLNSPGGCAIGPDGLLYVADQANNRVQVFTKSGAFVRKWGSFGPGVSQFNIPNGIAVDENGFVYVSDGGNNRIQKFTSAGAFVGQWGDFGSAAGKLINPSDVTTDREGSVYVVDAGNNRIQKFSSTGHFYAQYGMFGFLDGQFDGPDSIVVDEDFRVYVTDSGNDRVQVLQDMGNWFFYLGQWGGTGPGVGYFNYPEGIALDPGGQVFVADAGNDRIQKFERSGDFLVEWGSMGVGAGEFIYETGVAAGPARDVYVADTVVNRMQKFFSPVPTRHTRVEGTNRYMTAVAASKAAYPNGTRHRDAVIATGENWPDALGGAALAGAVGGPLLLVRTDEVPGAVMAELLRLKTDHVYILGGEDVVSEGVADTIAAIPGVTTVERLAGKTRYETAEAVAVATAQEQGTDYDGGAFVATGLNFPDALAASPLAARLGWPIFLARPSGVTVTTRQAMADTGVSDVHLLGGEDVVSADIETEMRGRYGSAHVWRLEGRTRYETAIDVAQFGVDEAGLTWSHTALCTGLNFPDGLAGGVLAGQRDSVLLLTKGVTLEGNVLNTFKAEKAEVYEVYYLGGTDVVSAAVEGSLRAVLY